MILLITSAIYLSVFCGTNLISEILTHSSLEDKKLCFLGSIVLRLSVLYRILTGSKTMCTIIANLTQLFRGSTPNSCCYSEPSSGQRTTRVAENFSQLFRVFTRYISHHSKLDSGHGPIRVATVVLVTYLISRMFLHCIFQLSTKLDVLEWLSKCCQGKMVLVGHWWSNIARKGQLCAHDPWHLLDFLRDNLLI